MRTLGFSTGLLIVLLLSSGAQGLHTHAGDFELTVEFDSIIVEPRVLPGELMEEEFFSTDEPGFDSAPGTFPAGTMVGFNIVDALKYWNGDGFDPLLPATGETMTVSFLQRLVQSGAGRVAGFKLPVADDGSWHRHLVFTLNGPATSPPVRGIYLLALELYSTDPQVAASYPFYIVFNVDAEPSHDLAVEWVHENLAGPVCISKPPGDLNADCRVDFNDFALLADNWLSCNLRPQSECWQ